MRTASYMVLGLLIGAGPIAAEPSVRLASPYALGITYQFTTRGQHITRATVPSHEMQHLCLLSYAPAEYVRLLLGAGAERFSVDEHGGTSFDGKYGFAPVAGLTAYTPTVARNTLRATLGVRVVHVKSEDTDGYTYGGPVVDADLGLVVHAGPMVDIECGARYHVIGGTMADDTGGSASFSNAQTIRGYLELSLVHQSGTYATVQFDASPDIGTDWSAGPAEASIGFAVGSVLWTRRRTADKTKSNVYFPEYDRLRKRLKSMEESLAD